MEYSQACTLQALFMYMFYGESYNQRNCSSKSSSSSISKNQDQSDKLDNAVMATILARLPVTDIFRCQYVSKRWNSIVHCPTFSIVFSQLFNRCPWFLMLDFNSLADAVFDMEENDWHQIRLPIPKDINGRPGTPVASSGGLMCFKTESEGASIVCNPLTGSARSLPRLGASSRIIRIAMNALTGSSFTVFAVAGKLVNLQIMVFTSNNNAWTKLPIRYYINNISLANNNEDGNEEDDFGDNDSDDDGEKDSDGEKDDDSQNNNNNNNNMERLPVTRVIEWTPMKEMAGVTTIDSNGKVMLYFLYPNGRLTGYDPQQGAVILYPRLFSGTGECAFDMVECGDRILFVVLNQTLLENPMLKVWELDQTMEQEIQWKLVSTMPPFMSKVYRNTDVDISCEGNGDYIMACIFSDRGNFNKVIMYDLNKDIWSELPSCFDSDGNVKKFVCAYSFKPVIEPNIV